jgi:hypothetical protein
MGWRDALQGEEEGFGGGVSSSVLFEFDYDGVVG